MEIDANELVKELSYLTKYYNLTDLLDVKLVEEAVKWLLVRTLYKSLRNMTRAFILDYYQNNHLIKEEVNVGAGLARWHLQVINDNKRNIYCGQAMIWDSSFHKITIRDFLNIEHQAFNGEMYKSYQPYDICDKCIVGFLRKDRKSKN